MKAFAIFPTMSVFILTFSILKGQRVYDIKKNLFWSSLLTIVFSGLIIGGLRVFHELAWLLMLINVVFALILIPILTFTINDFFPVATGKILWIRLFGIGLASILITAGLFGLSIFLAFANNPMDPGSK